MAKKSGSFRTTITLPLGLKKRMDEVAGQVNWSAVAARAFEEKLSEIASRKEKKTMSDVIQRLRASKRRAEDQAYRSGEADGRNWASSRAEVPELQALEGLRDSRGGDWDGWVEDNDSSDFSAAERLVFVLQPESQNRTTASEFWRAILDRNTELANDPSYVKGFIEGALGIWDRVKEEL
jgi:hypothetical protein